MAGARCPLAAVCMDGDGLPPGMLAAAPGARGGRGGAPGLSLGRTRRRRLLRRLQVKRLLAAEHASAPATPLGHTAVMSSDLTPVKHRGNRPGSDGIGMAEFLQYVKQYRGACDEVPYERLPVHFGTLVASADTVYAIGEDDDDDWFERPGEGIESATDEESKLGGTVDAGTITDVQTASPSPMDLVYDLSGRLVAGDEVVGEDDILDACADALEQAVAEWKDIFRITGDAGAMRKNGVIVFVAMDEEHYDTGQHVIPVDKG
eukprot:CAMPEP_0168365472 /NCGR_PEP_ID=MMETSP0228-20121227/4736_1 /TAXON_ID=133427 /ORGANISM="Protoceratium reticulatum, Strain CCCM 535 (=CCMP 1889)" /LENGTH=261 /DNA_ID=CAMNT_0008378255 /DNA_START=71 /DNA_END=856 /DNA_ORIENTATION=+